MKKEQFTHFGFKKVDWFEKTSLVKDVFDSVASKYDIMNDLMSFGIHRKWKYDFLQYILENNPKTLLDVGGGTADIAISFINAGKEYEKKKCYVVDINHKMLAKGLEKSINAGILSSLDFICANAEELPFKDNSMDCYASAFCLRNVTDLPRALQEAYRVLKPGGKFFCLEFSKVNNPYLSKVYDAWSFLVIPKMGQFITGNAKAYEYLVQSIRKFPDQEEYLKIIKDAGFKSVGYNNKTFGVATIHYGEK
jgi:demethylmenaquinone methyltransferase/2-methoxy-6-polyprenyl-1,4-benzoquinol methylase